MELLLEKLMSLRGKLRRGTIFPESKVLAKLPSFGNIKSQIKQLGQWGLGNEPFPSRFAWKKFEEGTLLPVNIHSTREEENDVLSYVFDDKPATGKIGRSLESLVQKAKPSIRDCVLYRGVRLDKDVINGYIREMKKGEEVIISMDRPSSWTNSPSSGWDFAKPTGFRAKYGEQSIIFQVLVPKGTKGVDITVHFGIGYEIILSKKTKIKVVEVEEYRTGYRITGILV